MNREDIKIARGLALVFIERAECVIAESKAAEDARLKAPRDARGLIIDAWTLPHDPLDGSAQSGALKRTSMELTRALARMRRRG